jgi:hypothetical protein
MAIPGFSAEASLVRAWRLQEQGRRVAEHIGPAGERGVVPAIRVAASGLSERATLTLRPDSYGKHCGIGRGSSDPPIDAVDEVCCRHDKCYCERGYADCSCDRGLIEDMPAAISQPGVSAEGRTKGALIAGLLAADPFCLCHRICHPSFPDVWNVECTDAGDLAVPGIPPLKLCPLPFA